MRKKIALSLIALVAVVGGVAAMSAYEAHVINVTAHIENALAVSAEALEFGTVFPQEYLERQFTVELSTSFQEANRVDDVMYTIKQKPKCECNIVDPTTEECTEGQYAPVDYATHECPTDYTVMESLCPFLSKINNDEDGTGDENDTSHPSYYTDPTPNEPNSGDESCTQPPTRYEHTAGFNPTGWAGWSCPLDEYAVGAGVLVGTANTYLWQPGASAGGFDYPATPFGYTYQDGETGMIIQNDGDDNETITYYVDCMPIVPDASGILTKFGDDISDVWTVDLKVPPVDGFVGQDWPAGCPTVPTNDVDYGCDLWIEVTGVSETPAPEPFCGDEIVNGVEECDGDASVCAGYPDAICEDCVCISPIQ